MQLNVREREVESAKPKPSEQEMVACCDVTDSVKLPSVL